MIHKKRSLLIGLLLCAGIVQAQNVAINTDGSKANPNAILDIRSSDKGLLIPRLTSDARLKISNTQGLLVYDVNTNSFWYNTGKTWVDMGAMAAKIADSAWALTGNTGTVRGTNFLGTTDNVALMFKVNNLQSGLIDHIKENAFFGYRAGMSIHPMPIWGKNNTAFGNNALAANTIAFNNTAIGSGALKLNTDGGGNTAVGLDAMGSNTMGGGNTAIGSGALFFNTTGQGNVATGGSALFLNTSGSFNTAYGTSALRSSTTSSFNAAFGYLALNQNTSGHDNSAFGTFALSTNSSGQANTGIGKEALNRNTTGNHNTGVGAYALLSNTIASGNTATGFQSLMNNLGGTLNTANGAFSLFTNRSGGNNTAMGYRSLYFNTGNNNTAVGTHSLASNTTGTGNTAQGADALKSNTTGSRNTAVGSGALFSITLGNENTAVGDAALFNVTINNANTAIGHAALLKNIGNSNTAVGYLAMVSMFNGISNTGLGARTDVTNGSFSNATAVGYEAIVNASNKVRIGNAAVTVIEGQVPFTTPSDGRFKFGVQEDVRGLDFIMQLRPVTYQFDVKKFDADLGVAADQMGSGYNEALQLRRSGFIAQEVEQAALKTGYNFSGLIKPKDPKEHYSLSYDAFVVPLVKAMQEQQQTIDEQNKKIAELQQQLDEIKKLLTSSK